MRPAAGLIEEYIRLQEQYPQMAGTTSVVLDVNDRYCDPLTLIYLAASLASGVRAHFPSPAS